MRWLFLSMLIIYAYTTPGEYLSRWPMDLAPSYEGLRDGCYQIARISLVLAGISILMATSTREKLMVGIYTLIKPLSILSLSPERFTARLYLTLQYIEKVKKQSAKQDKPSSWSESFKAHLSDIQSQVSSEALHLEAAHFGLLDCLCVSAFLMLIGIHL
jgi:energy-coupling factor transport system permease protein